MSKNKSKLILIFIGIILGIIFISTQVNACSCEGFSSSTCTWGVDCDRCRESEWVTSICYDKLPKRRCDSCFDGWDTRQKTCLRTTSKRVCDTCSRRVRVSATCSRRVTNRVCNTCTRTVEKEMCRYGTCYWVPETEYYDCNCRDESSWEYYDCSYNDWEYYDCNCRTEYTDVPYDCSEQVPRYVDCNCVDYFEYRDYDCSYWKHTDFDCGCSCSSATQQQIDDYNRQNTDPSKGADSQGNIINCGSNLFDSKTGKCKYSENNCGSAGYVWDGTECTYSQAQCVAAGFTWKNNECMNTYEYCISIGKTIVNGVCVGESKKDDCTKQGYNYDSEMKVCVYNEDQCGDRELGWLAYSGWENGGKCSVSEEDCPTPYFYNNICFAACTNFDEKTQICYQACPEGKTFIPGGYCQAITTGGFGESSYIPCIPKTKAEACGAIECGKSEDDGCGGTIECGPCQSSNQVCTLFNYKCCTPTTPEACGSNYGIFHDGCNSNYSCVCNGVADCVHNEKCYPSGTLLDHDNDGKIDICSYSKWKDLTLSIEFVSPTPYDELWITKFNMIKAKISQSYLKDLKFNFNNDKIVQINLSSLIFGASFDNNINYNDWVNNKEMEVKGNVKWEQDGKYGGAVYFNGVNSYLDIKGWENRLDNEESQYIVNEGYVRNTPKNDMINSFTFGGWIKATETHEIDAEAISGTAGTAGQKYVFEASHYAGTNNAGAGLSIGTNGISVYERGDNYMPAVTVYNGNIGTEWNHVMVVYENRNAKIYLNGELVKTGFTSQKQKIYAPTKIGAGTYGSFKGYVDEINIFNRALDANEIKSLYQTNIKKISEDEWEFSMPINSASMPYGYKEYNMTVCDTKKCEFERGFFYLVENNIPSIEVVEIDEANSNKKMFNVTNIGDVPLSYEDIEINTKNDDIDSMKRIVSSITKNSLNPKVIKKGDSYVVEVTFNYSRVAEGGRIIYNDYTTREFSEDKEQLYISYRDLELEFVLNNNIIYRKNTDLIHNIDCSEDEDSKFLIGGEEFYCSCNIICEKGQICPCVKKINKINILGSGGIPGIVNIIFDATGTKENE